MIQGSRSVVATAAAGLAVLIWSSLATLSVSLKDVPALQLTGLALCVGGSMALPWARQWKADWKAIAVGCYGLFVYHFLFILALRYAPAVQANLVHYLWPTLIVVLSPLVVPGIRLRPVHFAAAAAGFTGAALAIASRIEGGGLDLHIGYALALGAAFVWASYSLLLKRVATTSLPVTGLCCLLSGLFALGLHYGTQPTTHLSPNQVLLVIALGLGPMGAAFYL